MAKNKRFDQRLTQIPTDIWSKITKIYSLFFYSRTHWM